MLRDVAEPVQLVPIDDAEERFYIGIILVLFFQRMILSLGIAALLDSVSYIMVRSLIFLPKDFM